MWSVVVGLALVWSSEASVTVNCRNEHNENVDWYILYKAPKSYLQTDLKYIYIDPNGKRVISQLINSPKGVLANTLRPMFSEEQPSTFSFLSYSDQPPHRTVGDTYGHSKGVVLGDSGTQTALWLTHSTPQFPFKRDQSQFYPSSGHRYGQTFMCVTLPFSELSEVGKHLQYIRAFLFEHNIPSFPKEMILAANKTFTAPPGSFKTLTTKGKKELKIRAKKTGSKARYGDLYVQLAEEFKSDMNAQTGGRQLGREKSFDEPGWRKVINVKMVKTDLGEWPRCNDHSKWAVTTAKDIVWTCFSDVNRAISQYNRWGGALCIQDKNVNDYFKSFVDSARRGHKPPVACEPETSLASAG